MYMYIFILSTGVHQTDLIYVFVCFEQNVEANKNIKQRLLRGVFRCLDVIHTWSKKTLSILGSSTGNIEAFDKLFKYSASRFNDCYILYINYITCKYLTTYKIYKNTYSGFPPFKEHEEHTFPGLYTCDM